MTESLASNYRSYGAGEQKAKFMDCRVGCGACCIAPSISSAIPGMTEGKPAGVRCIQLTEDNRCKLFGLPERPAVCVRLRPNAEMCGANAEEALIYLTDLEQFTTPLYDHSQNSQRRQTNPSPATTDF